MNKKVLTAGIMFSTIVLGGGNIATSANIIMASAVSSQIRNEFEQVNNVHNEIKFIDENGKEIDNGQFFGEENKIYDISEIVSRVHLPEGYEVSPDQDKKIMLKQDGTIINIKVSDKRITNWLIFQTEDGKEVGTEEVRGIEGNFLRIYAPRNYKLAKTQSSEGFIGKDGHRIIVRVVYNAVKIKVILKRLNGDVLVELNTAGEVGARIPFDEIDDKLPKGFEYQNSFVYSNYIEQEGDIFELVILESNVKKKVKFVDEDSNQIGDMVEVEGREGDDIDLDGKLPDGYYQWNSFSFVDDDQTVIVKLRPEYDHDYDKYQTFLFVDKKGNIIDQSSAPVKKGKSSKVKPINGYKIVGNDRVPFVDNDDEKNFPKIVLEGLPQTNVLHLKDRATDKVVKTITIKGNTGDKVNLSKYEKDYVDPFDIVVSADEKDRTVLVNKIIKTEIYFVLANGTVVGKQVLNSPESQPMALKVPKGYVVTDNNSSQITASSKKPVQNILVVPSNGIQMPDDKDKVTTQINLVDKITGRTIYTYTVEGKHGQSVDIQIPENYELENSSNSKMTLNKSQKVLNLYVKEKQSNSTVEDHNSFVQTKLSMTKLFNRSGKEHANRALDFNSSWKTDQKLMLNGTTYYRVGNNEYVKTNEIIEYVSNEGVVQTKSESIKELFDINGKKNTARALAPETAWFTDRYAIINGSKMYRVATNEWVKASDVH